jgi:hypothetical protein
MAHYAFLDENNIVTEVITGRNEDEIVDGISDWEAHYGEFRGQVCKRTSYRTHAGQHMAGGTPFRFNYAAIGFTFDATKGTDGAFIPPQLHPSWVLNETTCCYEAPVPIPEGSDFNFMKWDEPTLSWVDVSSTQN